MEQEEGEEDEERGIWREGERGRVGGRGEGNRGRAGVQQVFQNPSGTFGFHY